MWYNIRYIQFRFLREPWLVQLPQGWPVYKSLGAFSWLMINAEGCVPIGGAAPDRRTWSAYGNKQSKPGEVSHEAALLHDFCFRFLPWVLTLTSLVMECSQVAFGHGIFLRNRNPRTPRKNVLICLTLVLSFLVFFPFLPILLILWEKDSTCCAVSPAFTNTAQHICLQ